MRREGELKWKPSLRANIAKLDKKGSHLKSLKLQPAARTVRKPTCSRQDILRKFARLYLYSTLVATPR